MSLQLYGIGACRGIAMGQARVISQTELEIPRVNLEPEELARQTLRYKAALTIVRQQMASIKTHIPANAPADINEFIDSHLLMLHDSAFEQGPINIINEQYCNAEWALDIQRDRLASVFAQMEDEYLKTREDDIDYLVNRIQSILLKGPVKGSSDLVDTTANLPHILVTQDLSPGDLILLKARGGSALVIERGGPTSHTAILARGLNIPTVIGIHHACRFLNNQDSIIVDGAQGLVLADPDNQFHKYFYQKHTKASSLQETYAQLKATPTMTADGHSITLRANMELPNDISMAQNVAAQGIGLFRTEYLFINRDHAPDESEQFHAYLDVITAMGQEVVTIRTFDLGNDKQPRSMKQDSVHDANPALGLRAIRLSLREPRLFRPQLKAILRASAMGKVRLLLPMLSCPTEIDRVLTIIDSVKQELSLQGFAYDNKIMIGGMIETPSAVLAIDEFTKKLDFISIGTNDLIQYTLAIDRNNEHINYLYNPAHPTVLNLIKQAIDGANRAKIPIALCGEMAGDIKYTRVLLALGLREFSMHPNSLLEVKHTVHNTHITKELLQQVEQLMQCYNQAQGERLLAQINGD